MKFIFFKSAMFFTAVLSLVGFAFAQSDGAQGIELFRQGKNKEAVAVLEKASKTAKTDAEVWNYLGLAYTKDESYKKAVKAFEQAVAVNARNATYQTNLAYVYLLSAKYNKAQSASEKAIALDPKGATAFYVRGTTSMWEGDTEDAVRDADQVIALNADYAQAYILKSDALLTAFGKRISDGAKPRDEIDLLKQSKEALETCLKNCRNNSLAESQKQRLETLQAFTDYFDRNKNEKLSAAFDKASGEPEPPESAAAAPDPNFTPLKILKKPRPTYTDDARQNNISGRVRMAVLFSERGRVTHVLVLRGLGGGLTENAIKAARKVQFEPARKNNQPISQVKIIEYSFSIR